MLTTQYQGGHVASVRDRVGTQKVEPSRLGLNVERLVLGNGLTVLLSPEPTAATAAVNMTFRAGTLFEPQNRAGMAHMVEHVMLRGRTPDTDYVAMLEEHGVVFLNAFTSAEFMSFELEVMPSAVPLAIWVNTDRLATLPQKLEANDLPRHRSVVDVERILRTVDVPFGAIDLAISRKLFPPPHPMRASVIGRPEELEQVTLRDVRTFVARYLVPANAIFTVTGRFDPAEVKAQLEQTLGRLPPGRRAVPPRRSSIEGKPRRYQMREYRARQPRVSVLWRLEGLGQRDRDALTIGGLLLSNYVDGAFGTQVRAGLSPTEGAAFFRLDVTLPYDKPVDAATAEAEVFLRYLTAVDMPRDYFNATRLAVDRMLLFMLDSVRGRAQVITQLELNGEDPTRTEAMSQRLWRLNRQAIRHVAWRYLIRDRGRLVVHARPVRPRLPKLSWEDR
ncbi:MAG: pitrilysin family protein [Myxococcota bacterium]